MILVFDEELYPSSDFHAGASLFIKVTGQMCNYAKAKIQSYPESYLLKGILQNL